MTEQTIVRENLMTRPGYSPYCGNPTCRNHSPRTVYDSDIKQFTCRCGWRSSFPNDFIKRYKAQWKK